MFPIRDIRGRVVGFGGRKMGDEAGPKYLNSPETPVFSKGQELYGLYEARKAVRNIDRLLVVEGCMDVVALAQNGFPNAVATLGRRQAKLTTTSCIGIPMRSFVVLMAIKQDVPRPGERWKARCRF